MPLEVFLGFLKSRGAQVICCGDHGQPPPIGGESPHDWLFLYADYSEDVLSDYRAKCPKLRGLKKDIRLRSDGVQFKDMRGAIPKCLSWSEFTNRWHPNDLILVGRKKIGDAIQDMLFARHKNISPTWLFPYFITRRILESKILLSKFLAQKKQELVLNDIVDVSFKAAAEAVKTGDWRLGYAMTIHSSQGLTISEDPWKVWIMNDHLKWSNLVYLAVSRVEYLRQIELVWVLRQLSVKSEGKYEDLISRLTRKCNDPEPLQINVFDRIFQNDKKAGIALEGHFIAKALQDLVVVRDESTGKIMTFPGHEEFWDWYRDLPEKHVHEIIFGHKLQRIKFDLDITRKEQADAKMEAMMDKFLNVVLDELCRCPSFSRAG